MNDEVEGVRQMITSATGWHHWIPFAALAVKQDMVPANRPMATRLLEQAFVAIIAGGGSAYGTINVSQAHQEEQIRSLSIMQTMQMDILKEQMRDSEIRLTSQIIELRSRQLK